MVGKARKLLVALGLLFSVEPTLNSKLNKAFNLKLTCDFSLQGQYSTFQNTEKSQTNLKDLPNICPQSVLVVSSKQKNRVFFYIYVQWFYHYNSDINLDFFVLTSLFPNHNNENLSGRTRPQSCGLLLELQIYICLFAQVYHFSGLKCP